MTDLSTMFAADLEAIKGDFPGDLVWNGQTVAGTMSPVRRSAQVLLEGMQPDYDRIWVGKLALFTNSTPPDPGDDCSIESVTYFVVDRVTDLGVVTLTLRRR